MPDSAGGFRRLRMRGGLGIQSKLLVMLLSVALISILVTGLIGYFNGRASLSAAAFEQLTTIRELRANELEATIKTIQTGVRLDTRTTDTVNASVAFNAAFDELTVEGPFPAERERILSFYESTFLPALEERSGSDYSADGLLPHSEAGIYLQANYTTNSGDFDESLTVTDAGDGSAWSAAHAQFHPYFQGLIAELGYEDVLLTNTKGQVVYSAYKGTDLGLNLFDAPENQSALSKAIAQVLQTDSVNSVVTTDFERYIPSLNVPTAWIVSPVAGGDGVISGVMAVQVPTAQINDTLTGNEDWASQGLGYSGEVYVVGEDKLMRSMSRALIDNPDDYAAAAIGSGLSPATAERIVAVNGTVLLQTVDTLPVERALHGETGTTIARGYLGASKLSSYTPLTIDEGPRWVVVASMDESEAFAPVVDFTKIVLLSAAVLVLLVGILALFLARIFTRPLNRLLGGVRRVAAGDRDVEVDTGTRDEYAEVGGAFNDLSRNLQTKADLLDAERTDNERLLLSLMPAAVVDRYRQGDETIAEDHKDVTVIYADFVGFDEFAADLDSGRSLAFLNEILLGLDELAGQLGIERVRTTKQGYLASCGLTLPRMDSARRVVEFATAADQLVARMSAQWNTRLALRAGIDSGSVTSGLIGRTSVVYDMWGEAVNLAYRLQDEGPEAGILMSQRVADRLGDMYPLGDAGTVDTKTGTHRIWRLERESEHV